MDDRIEREILARLDGGVGGYIAANGVGSDIVALARSGRMIEAIKIYRQRTGADLRQAKAAVEQAARGY